LIIANFIVSSEAIDQLWFVLSPQNPFKSQKELLNEYHRQYLLQSAIEGENKLKCSTIEFHLPRPSYTIDTLIYIEEKYKNDNFTVIIGSDSFQNINKWKNSETLLNKYQILIYQRPGFEIEDKKNGNIKILKAPLLDIKSSDIRKRIKEGKSIRFFVPDVVYEEIVRNNYYKRMPL
jgi:nicotinate-nucleotide adenylyltransferase